MKNIDLQKATLQQYAKGKRSFRSLTLDEMIYNFNNVNLAGADFSNSFITATFKNANLEGCTFHNCNLKTCDFSGANLINASFIDSLIDATVFKNANLSGANFTGTSEQGYSYKKNEFPGDD